MPKVKKVLRQTLKNIRRQLPIEFKQQMSKRVCHHISHLSRYRHAKHIGLYMSANGEIDLSPVWKTAPHHGKFCYFPKLNPDKTLIFLPATPRSHFIANKYNIDEPDVADSFAIELEQLDIVFLPLVGFDSRCNRLGMGAGYYDRTFGDIKRPLMIGVAFEFQHQDYIPTQDWDVPLDAVITEKTIYRKLK